LYDENQWNTMSENELLYALALQNIPKIGEITAKKLIHHCGSPEAVLKESRQNLLKIDGIGAIVLQGIFDTVYLENAASELRFIKDNNITTHYFMDDGYPDKLKHCVDGPILLFQSGNICLKSQPIISIVGTRKITTHGVHFCENLVEQLAIYNPIIVSGFAYGTDITAQRAAVKHNLQTIGCKAHLEC
jgi:DNA processing protein